jgi:hypothetical protein
MSDANGHQSQSMFGVNASNFNNLGNTAKALQDRLAAESSPEVNAAKIDFAKDVGSLLASPTPVGDAIDIVDAINNPTPLSVGMAAAGLIPGVTEAKALGKFGIAALRKLGFATHHIAPKSLRNHPLLGTIGLDIDSAVNTMILPTKEGLHGLRTIHRGMHRRVYTQQFQNLFDSLNQQVKSGKITVAEARAAVRQALAKMRQELRNGTRSLNKASDKTTQPKGKTTDATNGGGTDNSKW